MPLVSQPPASFGFCCLVSKSTGDSIPLFVCLRFGLWNISMDANTSCLAALRVGYVRRRMRCRFKSWKKLSATALAIGLEPMALQWLDHGNFLGGSCRHPDCAG